MRVSERRCRAVCCACQTQPLRLVGSLCNLYLLASHSWAGVKRSWWEALLMTPASCLTEFLTRKVFFKTEFLLPPSVGNQDNLLMRRTVWSRLSTGRKPRSLPWGSFLLGGRVALPQCSLMKNLHWIWSKGRLGLRTSGRMEGLHLGARKNLPK